MIATGHALKCHSGVIVPGVYRQVQQMGQSGPRRAVQSSPHGEEGGEPQVEHGEVPAGAWGRRGRSRQGGLAPAQPSGSPLSPLCEHPQLAHEAPFRPAPPSPLPHYTVSPQNSFKVVWRWRFFLILKQMHVHYGKLGYINKYKEGRLFIITVPKTTTIINI